jgi:hypothetical protein
MITNSSFPPTSSPDLAVLRVSGDDVGGKDELVIMTL